jgi:hypothetical protein
MLTYTFVAAIKVVSGVSEGTEKVTRDSFPGLRVRATDNSEERAQTQKRLNFTRLINSKGFDCIGTIPSTNKTDYFVQWFVTDGIEAAYLESNKFECTPAMRTIKMPNCDMSEPRTCKDGKGVTPDVSVFNGTASCSDLMAAMYILHDEDLEDDEACGADKVTHGRELADTDQYTDTCSGSWRQCPYNVYFTGKISPIITTKDSRFHQHAHNIQDNYKGWQGCAASDYKDMAGFARWKRATYKTNIDTLIDIYEGGNMKKCTAQDNWFVHMRGYAFGTFCATQELQARSTHMCEPRHRESANYCFSSDQQYCLMDFDTKKDDDAKCGPIKPGPRTAKTRNAWCCGACS